MMQLPVDINALLTMTVDRGGTHTLAQKSSVHATQPQNSL